MPEQAPDKRLNFREFVSLTVWVTKAYFRIAPFWVSVDIVGNLLNSLFPLISSFIFAKVLDALIQLTQSSNADLSVVLPYIAAYFLFQEIQGYVRSMNRNADTYFRYEGRTRLKLLYIDKMDELGIQTLEDPEVANKMARSDENLAYINSYLGTLMGLISAFLGMLAAALSVLASVPFILPIIVIVSVPEILLNRHYVGKIWKYDKDTTEDRRRANWNAGELSESKSLQEILISGAFWFVRDKYAQFMSGYDVNGFKLRKQWRFYGFLLGVGEDIGIFVGYFFIFARLIAKQISIGDTTFQMRALDYFSGQLGAFVSILTDLQEQAVRLSDIVSLLQMKPLFTDGKIKMPYPATAPSISIQNMTFSYPRSEKPIFKHLNLGIAAGEKVAIVGHNGAGKTTLVKIISRLYPINEGQILVNGINLNAFRLGDWHQNIGVLFQDFNTYGQMSVKDNIYAGRPTGKMDMEKVKTAAKNADASDFIEEFPLKYDQLLNEKFKTGIRPSGGMWQKIAIARFFYRNAPLVIFDEPTAAIDAVSEYKIFNRIYKFFQNKTVIIISHRFSTVRNADRIIVMDKGRIVEEGTHEQLMAMEGNYAHAFKLQAEGYQH